MEDAAATDAAQFAPPLLLHVGPTPGLAAAFGQPGLGADLVHADSLLGARCHLLDDRLACVVVELSALTSTNIGVVESLCRSVPDVPVLVVIDEDDEEYSSQLVERGAQDVIARHWLQDGKRLRQTIRFAVQRHRMAGHRVQSELRYRTAFEHAPIGMVVMDLCGRIVRVNPSLLAALGRTEADLLDTSIVAVFGSGELAGALEGRGLAEAADVAAGFQAELRYQHAMGRVGWGRFKASVVKDHSGQARQIIGQLEDVTAFRLAQAQLSELVATKERKLRHEEALAKCSAVLLMSEGPSDERLALEALLEATDASSLFIEVNVADPDLGPCSSLVHEVSQPGVIIDLEYWALMPWTDMPDSFAALSQGKPFVVNQDELSPIEAATYAGQDPAAEVNVPIFTNGTWAGLIGFSDDDPSRQWEADEIRLLQTAAEMLGSFWERRQDRERLEKLIRSKDELVAAVSHELRTPLTAVVALAHELFDREDDFAPEERTEFLGLIANQSTEVADIVEDLLVAARADIGKVAVTARAICIRDETERVLAGVPQAGGDAIDVHGPKIEAWADPTRTRQIIRNLVTNAVRHGGNRIRVEVGRHGDRAVLRVADDGPGVDEAHARRIFEPYERAHDSGSQPASVGLGLTISRELAHLMGGELSYQRRDHESVFELSLPTA